MTLVIIGSILLLALLGAPLFAVIGLAALLAFHTAEIDPSAIFIELYRITNPNSHPTFYFCRLHSS